MIKTVASIFLLFVLVSCGKSSNEIDFDHSNKYSSRRPHYVPFPFGYVMKALIGKQI